MEKTFRAKPTLLEQLQKKRRGEYIQTGFYAFLTLIVVVFTASDSAVLELAHSLGGSVEMVKTGRFVFILLFLGLMFLSLLWALQADKQLRRLNSSYITLTEQGVNGTFFPDPAGDAVPFSLRYEDVLSVKGTAESGLNLTVVTSGGTCGCLEIERAESAARMIREKAEQTRPAPAPATPEPPAQKPAEERVYCMLCGANVPAKAVFCPKCGKRMDLSD